MNDHGLKFDDCVKETFGFICWVLINLLKSRCSYYNLSVDDAIAARAPTQPSATRARTWWTIDQARPVCVEEAKSDSIKSFKNPQKDVTDKSVKEGLCGDARVFLW